MLSPTDCMNSIQRVPSTLNATDAFCRFRSVKITYIFRSASCLIAWYTSANDADSTNECDKLSAWCVSDAIFTMTERQLYHFPEHSSSYGELKKRQPVRDMMMAQRVEAGTRGKHVTTSETSGKDK